MRKLISTILTTVIVLGCFCITGVGATTNYDAENFENPGIALDTQLQHPYKANWEISAKADNKIVITEAIGADGKVTNVLDTKVLTTGTEASISRRGANGLNNKISYSFDYFPKVSVGSYPLVMIFGGEFVTLLHVANNSMIFLPNCSTKKTVIPELKQQWYSLRIELDMYDSDYTARLFLEAQPLTPLLKMDDPSFAKTTCTIPEKTHVRFQTKGEQTNEAYFDNISIDYLDKDLDRLGYIEQESFEDLKNTSDGLWTTTGQWWTTDIEVKNIADKNLKTNRAAYIGSIASSIMSRHSIDASKNKMSIEFDYMPTDITSNGIMLRFIGKEFISILEVDNGGILFLPRKDPQQSRPIKTLVENKWYSFKLVCDLYKTEKTIELYIDGTNYGKKIITKNDSAGDAFTGDSTIPLNFRAQFSDNKTGTKKFYVDNFSLRLTDTDVPLPPQPEKTIFEETFEGSDLQVGSILGSDSSNAWETNTKVSGDATVTNMVALNGKQSKAIRVTSIEELTKRKLNFTGPKTIVEFDFLPEFIGGDYDLFMLLPGGGFLTFLTVKGGSLVCLSRTKNSTVAVNKLVNQWYNIKTVLDISGSKKTVTLFVNDVQVMQETNIEFLDDGVTPITDAKVTMPANTAFRIQVKGNEKNVACFDNVKVKTSLPNGQVIIRLPFVKDAREVCNIENGEISTGVTVYNYDTANEPYHAVIAIAVYERVGESTMLKSIGVSDSSVAGGDCKTISAAATASGNTFAKAFVWDGNWQIIPMMNANILE